MVEIAAGSHSSDPYNLQRFVSAQEGVYQNALAEIQGGRKTSHWMWFVFPQASGLGRSSTSQRYAIGSRDEAACYLQHPILGPRLVEITEALLRLQGRSAHDIFGSPDHLKLRSCATLFAEVSPPASVFQRVLERYFGGKPDARTLELLKDAPLINGGR